MAAELPNTRTVAFFFFGKGFARAATICVIGGSCRCPPCGALHHTNVAAGQRRHACARPVEPLGVLFEGEDVAAGVISCVQRFGGDAWFRRIAEEDGDCGFIRFLDEAGVPLICARVVVLPVGGE